MKLHLIRHAESEGNSENILQGHRDYPLTLGGLRQARYLRDVIYEAYNYDVVFTSTSERALRTAKLSQDIPFIDMDDLREMDFGSLSGKKITGFSQEDKEIWGKIFTDHEYNAHGGESVSEFGIRVTGALLKINRYMMDYNHEDALVYTHMGVIKAIFKGLLNKDIELDNTGIATIEILFEDGKLLCREELDPLQYNNKEFIEVAT